MSVSETDERCRHNPVMSGADVTLLDNALPRPLDQPERVTFEDLFDPGDIQRIQDDFSAATGVASIITRPDGTPITRPSNFCRLCRDVIRCTEIGRRNCFHSDSALGGRHPGGPRIQPCLSGGLWDAGTSICVGDRHIANWLIGQVRDETQSEQGMLEYARTIGADETAFLEAFREVPVMSLARFTQVAQALFTLASQLSGAAYQNVQQARFIGERQQAEEALRKSEETYRALVEGLPDFVARFDRQGRHLFVSANGGDMFGVRASQFIGKTHRELGYSEALCRLWGGAIQRVFKNGAPYETEFRLDGKRGRMILNWRLMPERDVQGVVQSVLSISRDITAHRLAEENYRTLFREMLDGFALHEIICDEKGRPVDYRFLTVNPAFERLTGLKAEEVEGRTVRDVLPGIESHWIETYGKVALTGEPTSFEDFATELGRHYEVKAFRPAPGQFACILADTTEGKRVQEDKARLEAQLQQAQKMESVGRLAGGVAHDFNNMLGVILGNTEIALGELTRGDPLFAELLEIRKAAERSADLTRQLLAFARKQTVTPKVLNLSETVEGMLKMLKRLIGEDIDLVWKPKLDLWPVRVDPSQVDQILANLSVNARDAIHDVGRVMIETGNCVIDEESCERHAGFLPGEYVMLVVSDNGCGMDQEAQLHLFEPFFTTKNVGHGTGLGLATVYGIVKQNNGHISVHSEKGIGTTFKVFLPRHVSKPGQSQKERALEPVKRGQETVLLVEDEPAMLRLITRLVERLGYTVLAARSPGEAIRLATECRRPIHLLMTDVIMPEMNGRELARTLLAFCPNLKRLFMSGYTADVIAHHGVLDVGVHFIQKPMSMNDLATKVREALDSE